MFFKTPQVANVSLKDLEILRDVTAAFFQIVYNITKVKKTQKRIQVAPTCHEMSRAINILFPNLKLVSGYYHGLQKNEGKFGILLTEHSWLETPDGSILDPYPVQAVSGSQVLLIATKGMYESCGAVMYQYHEDGKKFHDRLSEKRAKRLVAFHDMGEIPKSES